MADHTHDWRPAGPVSAAGSQLLACADDRCDEIAYLITPKEPAA